MKNNGKENKQYLLLDEYEQGEFISQDILDSLEQENQELFEILQVSNQLRSAKKVEPDPFYSRVSQIRIYYRMVKDRGPKLHPLEEIKYFFAKIAHIEPPSFALRPVFTVFIALILSFSVFVGGAQAADNARPGQFLYPVDLALENLQLSLTFNEQSRLKLQLDFAEERLAEAEAEFLQGQSGNAQIALAGYEKVQQSINVQLDNNQLEMTAELQNSIVASHQKNTVVLTNLMGSVPQSSQEAVLRAIEVTQTYGVQPPTAQQPAGSPPGESEQQVAPDNESAAEAVPPLQADEEPAPQPTKVTPPAQVLVPTPTLVEGQQFFATVWIYSVNVHNGPGLEYPVVGWLFQDQTIQSNTCENGFVFIPEFSGWVKGTCFEPNPCGPPGSCLQLQD